MEKIIQKWGKYLIAGLLIAVYVWGSTKMYFHQDDLDWFILANRPVWAVMQAPIGDHVNYLWRALLVSEWNLFGFNFAPYLLVSILIHASVIYLLYQISWKTTRRKDLSMMAAMIFVINTNWTESILWISGQTISITALLVLLGMYTLVRKKGEILPIILNGITSALSLGFLGSTLINYGYDFEKKKVTKVGMAAIMALLIVFGGYFFKGSDGTKIAFSLAWVIKVGEVCILMLVNTVIGRLIIPFDRYEIVRIALVLMGMLGLMVYYSGKLREIWSDKWSRFLIIQGFFYNLIVAIGRAQFGVGIMRAERYAYLGLAIFLLIVVRNLRHAKIKYLGSLVFLIGVIQMVGFYRRASDYIVRPQQLKQLVWQIETGQDQSESEKYLPHFVLNDERLKYGDLYPLIKR